MNYSEDLLILRYTELVSQLARSLLSIGDFVLARSLARRCSPIARIFNGEARPEEANSRVDRAVESMTSTKH